MRGMTEGEAKRLAGDAQERGLDARACWDDRFGWVVRSKTPFHQGEVVLRTFTDVLDVLMEVAGWS